MAKTLHLVIPGLLGPWLNNQGEFAFSKPAAPALEWLLARTEVQDLLTLNPSLQERENSDKVLFQLFGLPIPIDADFPVAAVTWLADGGEMGEDKWWLRADPVYLRPDLHGVLLVDARVLALEPAEVEALGTVFNQVFAEDGLRLDTLRPDRWYLRLPADPGLRTHPLSQVIGRNLNALMPYGVTARHWNGLLTEIQMLFHHHSVNRAREERHQPLINSVWFWGGGYCPSGGYCHKFP